MNSRCAFFELIKPTTKIEPGTPPKALSIPSSETESMLEKWKTYESEQTGKLKENIVAGRKVAVEILITRALGGSVADRERLAAEAERIKKLSVDMPLGVSAPSTKDQRILALTGHWNIDNWWPHEFTEGGLFLDSRNRSPLPWRWINRQAGVLAVDEVDFTNVFWMESADTLRLINAKFARYVVKKKRNIATIPFQDEGLGKLNQSEVSQREALENDLETKRQNLVTWLLSKAKDLSPESSLKLLPKITALEGQTHNGASRLAGVWKWDKNADVRFQSGKRVTTKSDISLGTWDWVCGSKRQFVVVLNGGKAANDVFFANAPKDSADLSVTVHRMGDGKFTAIRTLP